MVDYAKILRVVLEHFASCEGTDYLSGKGETESFNTLTDEENAALTRTRDEYRRAIGWSGYGDDKPASPFNIDEWRKTLPPTSVWP